MAGITCYERRLQLRRAFVSRLVTASFTLLLLSGQANATWEVSNNFVTQKLAECSSQGTGEYKVSYEDMGVQATAESTEPGESGDARSVAVFYRSLHWTGTGTPGFPPASVQTVDASAYGDAEAPGSLSALAMSSFAGSPVVEAGINKPFVNDAPSANYNTYWNEVLLDFLEPSSTGDPNYCSAGSVMTAKASASDSDGLKIAKAYAAARYGLAL